MPALQQNAAAMDAFRQRASARGPVPIQGGQAPQGGVPSAPVPTGGQTPKSTDSVGILKQVAGEITEDEMIQALIQRLKGLMTQSKPQGGSANVSK